MIKKKKRIIAKYAEGDPGFFEKVGKSLKNFGLGVADKFKGVNTGDVMGAAAGASLGIANSMGIEQSKAGSVISGIGSVVSMIPGWGLIAGPAIQMLGNFTGGGGSVDENTGEVQTSSGLTRLFGWGRSDASLFRKSNRIKNTKVAKAQTENILAEYYNDPNVEVQPNVLAAEGGIMRRPVDALVSKGELIYDPTTKELMKVPGSKGKPNKKDDVPIRLYEGDVVLSNSPTMLMANGKTPAQNVERFINKKSKSSDGTVKAREAIIKKVVNWLEANKTKPQQYAMYSNGEDNVGITKELIDEFVKQQNAKRDATPLGRLQIEIEKQLSQKSADAPLKGGETVISEPKNDTTPAVSSQTTPVKKIVPISTNIKKYAYNPDLTQFSYWDKERGDYKKEYLDWVNALTDQDVKDIYDGKYGDMSQYLGENKGYIPSVEEARRLMTDKKYGNWHKIGQIVKDSVKLPDDEWDFVEEELDVPITKVKIIPRYEKFEPIVPEIKGKVRKPKSGDLAYKAASILTPLLDHAEPEAVNYETPIAKFRPTGIDVSRQLREIDDSYAMARYNQANISPNTGAGMIYGLLAAANRAKQMSDVYNWQTNAQNQLIGHNVDTYNKWSADYASIMNNVYDKAAANRAAARNINRQNTATALNNWGQILRDDKLNTLERMKFAALKPAISATYEDASAAEVYNMYKELFG